MVYANKMTTAAFPGPDYVVALGKSLTKAELLNSSAQLYSADLTRRAISAS